MTNNERQHNRAIELLTKAVHQSLHAPFCARSVHWKTFQDQLRLAKMENSPDLPAVKAKWTEHEPACDCWYGQAEQFLAKVKPWKP